MAKYYTLVTDVGRAKMANAQVMGEKVSFSQIALGSSETKPRENQTALGKEEWRGPISNVSLDKDNPNWIVVEAVVPSHVGGFEISEVGVYDEEGHLIVVGNHPKTYKPKMNEGTTKDVAIRIVIEVSNSEIVELKVDPSVVIATREYVKSAIELAMASIDFSTVKSVADIAPDATGDVPLTIGDLTTDNYLPPTAPPRDYPLGITTFRGNATQSKEWQDLVGDGIVNTRVLVVTYKANNVWQATQTIYLIDGYANTGNTIQHRAMYVRSSMASTQSSSNQWSDPVKILDNHDLSDSTTSDSSDTIATSKAVKDTMDAAKAVATKVLNDAKAYTDLHSERTDNPHKVTKSQIGLGNVQNYAVATKDDAKKGLSNTKYMTALRTAEAIKALGASADGVVKSVADIAPDSTGDVPLTIGDLTTDNYLPPTAPPRDYPLGITTFRGNATQSKEWQDLVGDGIVNTRVLVVTYKSSNVWQATQTIYLIDGYANTGNTIQHRAMYVRSSMASTQSSSNQWSDPVKILDNHDLSDSTTSDSSDTVATSKAVKDTMDAAKVAQETADKAKAYTNEKLGDMAKTVNDKLSELDSEDINVIDAMPSDAPLTDYPKGVSTFYINVTDAGYPNQYGTVTTYAGGSNVTGYQTFVLNNFNASRRKIFIRYYHNTPGWSEWYQVMDEDDYSDLVSLMADTEKELERKINDEATKALKEAKAAQKRADEAFQLGVKQKQATADSLTSIGASLPSDPTWDRLQSEIKKADYVREAEVTISAGQTNATFDFYPTTVSGRSYNQLWEIYYCIPTSFGHLIFREGKIQRVNALDIVGKTIKLENPLPVDIDLHVTGVAKK